MRLFILVLLACFLSFCGEKSKSVTHNFSEVDIQILVEDSISVRAIDIYKDSLIGFGYNKGYGFLNLKNDDVVFHEFKVTDSAQNVDNWITEQRAVTFSDRAFYSLSIGSPARLRKIDIKDKTEKIVYKEIHEKVFYDAIAFWNDKEGIAMGDPTNGCLSIIITRDGGETWQKTPCTNLPATVMREAAFAASNGNISIVDEHTWIISGGMKSRVFYSPDKGKTWQVFDTPIIQGTATTGGYSLQFYDESNGVIFGGDYTQPENNKGNKAITKDGGRTWQLIADQKEPGYKSCVRYIPNSGGHEMVAVGFTGISISNNGGVLWKELSKESFYTLRFINDSTAIAAGKNRIAKLTFK
ncbi:oxidoreductase [Aquimarina sp. AU474]|uniref:WD40/YVTN/BNR-like repeat-containing protein n=1 Tax=Aquimarina sp. AU474 TaxID=2108529 RepID=UPI000D6A04D2|nr:oxidoreductase [Aquimarina sp. AU474]